MLTKFAEKCIDKILDLLFEPIWARIIMMIASPAISVYLAKANQLLSDPLFLWFSGLFGFGAMLWIINNVHIYRNNRKDKSFHETFLQFRLSDKGNGEALIEIDDKKNIDYYRISDVYYDIKDQPIVMIGVTFIKPIYYKPKPTSRIRGYGNSHAVGRCFSFYEEKDYIYNMTFVAEGIQTNSSYVVEVKKNEGK